MKLKESKCFSYFVQDEIDAEVAALLNLKAQYKNLTGEDISGGKGKKEKKNESNKENKKKKQQEAKPAKIQAKPVQNDIMENGEGLDGGPKKITRYVEVVDQCLCCGSILPLV